jgi:alkanesulfonate monooxygenase SsuD/methylene tetrahydromethanopterin reductase-like flavin-dependent oxidoreductase (luciferase family)
MGAKAMNFHANLFARMGYEAEVDKIQELFLAGRKAEAIASVPTALVEDVALIGSPAKIRDELQLWEDSVVTSLLVQSDPRLLPMIAELLG